MPARAKFKGGDQSEISQCYVTPNALILIAALSLSVVAQPAQAEVMSAAEIAEQIVDKDLVARRMGARVHLRYDVSGTVTIRAPFFSGTGSWERDGDLLCMTSGAGQIPEPHAMALRTSVVGGFAPLTAILTACIMDHLRCV